jgi:phytanoyl-CoA hydroxylase
MLTRKDIDAFGERGFAIAERTIEGRVLETIRRDIEETLAGFDPDAHRAVFTTGDRDRGRDEVFFRSAERVEYFLEQDALDVDGRLQRPLNRAVNKLGHALHDHLPAIGALARLPALRQALQALGQKRPQVWQSMAIFKQPGIGDSVRWHQDATYLYTEPASVIGTWIALEDATRDNGCLLVDPHGPGPLRERYEVDWSSRTGELTTLCDVPWPEDRDALALEVPAGSVVFFSDHLPHASAANRSDRSRLAVTLHTADADRSRWSERNWLQRRELPPFLLD